MPRPTAFEAVASWPVWVDLASSAGRLRSSTAPVSTPVAISRSTAESFVDYLVDVFHVNVSRFVCWGGVVANMSCEAWFRCALRGRLQLLEFIIGFALAAELGDPQVDILQGAFVRGCILLYPVGKVSGEHVEEHKGRHQQAAHCCHI